MEPPASCVPDTWCHLFPPVCLRSQRERRKSMDALRARMAEADLVHDNNFDEDEDDFDIDNADMQTVSTVCFVASLKPD